MRDGIIHTVNVIPNYKNPITLSEILEKNDVDAKFFLNNKQLEKFKYLKGSKRIEREAKSGHKYFYSEGSMSYPDSYERPGRTMLTSEGTINRSTHVVVDYKTGKYRYLTPIECERLNQFPDNWTNTMSDKKRYFMMGNALVTGVIKKIGEELKSYIEKED